MTEEDYRCCYYIDSEMRFYTYEDFCKNAHAIKRLYKCLTKKIFYKWYVYAHNFSEKKKNIIWEFLNDDTEYEKLNKYRKKDFN